MSAPQPSAPQPAATFPYPWYFRPVNWLLVGLSRLPLAVLYGLARLLYWLMAYALRYRRRVVLENLRNSFPEKSEAQIGQIASGFYWHFAQVMVEILKLRTLSAAEMRQRVVIENPEVLERLFAENRQVLTLGSHTGNWEWILPSGAVVFPGRVTGVYKPLMNPFFEAFLWELRTHLGAKLVPMKSTLRDLLRHRGQGRALSMLSDQAAGPEDQPYWTTFLQQDTPFYTGADKLAAQFGCAAVYVTIRRVRRGYYRIILTELHDGQSTLPPEQHQLTEAFARLLERDIQARPSDYLWSHRRWKQKREASS